MVTLSATPLGPAVGVPVTLTVSISTTNGNAAGFFLTTDVPDIGTFRSLEPGTSASKDGVTHTMPRAGTAGAVTFKAEWTASVATGVGFSVYALSANGDGRSSGDSGGEAHLSTVSGCVGSTYYIDQDGDGFGSADPNFAPRRDCTRPLGYADKAGDCDDFRSTVHPDAPEICDGKDNDCNGKVDDDIVYSSYCVDGDGDGHGTRSGMTKMDCAPSAGFGDCQGDCNDADKTSYPGATEVCDGRDNDCDGRIDEGVRAVCGQGWCARYADGCSTVCTPGPPMIEACNAFDDDCDGVVDNGSDADLCGRPGLTCTRGQCVPDGNAGTGGDPGSGPDAGPVDGSRATDGGSGGTGRVNPGDGASPEAGGGVGASAEAGGCAGCSLTGWASRTDGSSAEGVGILSLVLGLAVLRRRRRDPSQT